MFPCPDVSGPCVNGSSSSSSSSASSSNNMWSVSSGRNPVPGTTTTTTSTGLSSVHMLPGFLPQSTGTQSTFPLTNNTGPQSTLQQPHPHALHPSAHLTSNSYTDSGTSSYPLTQQLRSCAPVNGAGLSNVPVHLSATHPTDATNRPLESASGFPLHEFGHLHQPPISVSPGPTLNLLGPGSNAFDAHPGPSSLSTLLTPGTGGGGHFSADMASCSRDAILSLSGSGLDDVDGSTQVPGILHAHSSTPFAHSASSAAGTATAGATVVTTSSNATNNSGSLTGRTARSSRVAGHKRRASSTLPSATPVPDHHHHRHQQDIISGASALSSLVTGASGLGSDCSSSLFGEYETTGRGFGHGQTPSLCGTDSEETIDPDETPEQKAERERSRRQANNARERPIVLAYLHYLNEALYDLV
ncbi:unnamed protein product [Echinostoma caproni]|uniref:Uncharacterized protein n=1 Tax=Echinostoma caproni TaxID=27848 RepID=A0A183B2T9_9TREM|nr:unnamed protein product [Echinostoma caproni]